MTRGFYDQIGVPFDADLDQIRAAYGRSVAQILRRREATVGQGGDTAALDLTRVQIDEAWEILSDPARRRRYDAMLAVAADGSPPGDPDALWSRVVGAMIHPAVAAGARLVDATTRLQLGPLPEAPRAVGARPPAPGWEEDATLTARVQAVMRDSFGPRRVAGRPTSPGEEAIRPPADPPRAAPARVPSSTPAHPPAYPPAYPTGGSHPAYPPAYPTASGPPTTPSASAPPPAPAQRLTVQAGPAARPPGFADPPGTYPGAVVRSAEPPRATVSAAPQPGPYTPHLASPPSPGPSAPPHAPAPWPAPAAARAVVVVPPVEPVRVALGPSGALLRSSRESKSLSIAQVSEATHISARYLEALEAEDFSVLPSSATFVKGYVREVARLLDLDEDRVVAGYMRRFSGDA